MSPRVFRTQDGRRLMELRPAPKLHHSGMVRDVLAHGRAFVADLDTGLLTITSGVGLTEERRPSFVRPQYVVPTGSRSGPLVLPMSPLWSIAREQLIEFSIDLPPGRFEYNHRRAYLKRGEWRDFERRVRNIYKYEIHTKNGTTHRYR